MDNVIATSESLGQDNQAPSVGTENASDDLTKNEANHSPGEDSSIQQSVKPNDVKAEEDAPGIPDFMLSPNAVLKDEGVQWRHGRAPDYSKTRKAWEETKTMAHSPQGLETLVENLVKNWEIEASFKPRIEDWRTIDRPNYSFKMGSGKPFTAEEMIEGGTYNAILSSSKYYDPKLNNFTSSHKTFKRMMPYFAWEVLEVYTGPPKVLFRWRHWGVMKGDYVAFNDKGEKITIKAHGGMIDIEGVTSATVNEKFQIGALHTWMSSDEMYQQMASGGIVNEEPALHKSVDPISAEPYNPPGSDGVALAELHNSGSGDHADEAASEDVVPKHISNITGQPADAFIPLTDTNITGDDSVSGTEPGARSETDPVTSGIQLDKNVPANVKDDAAVSDEGLVSSEAQHGPTSSAPQLEGIDKSFTNFVPSPSQLDAQEGSSEQASTKHDDDAPLDALDDHLEQPAEVLHPHDKTTENAVKPGPGEAVVAPADSDETQQTIEEMSTLTPSQCPFLMNRE